MLSPFIKRTANARLSAPGGGVLLNWRQRERRNVKVLIYECFVFLFFFGGVPAQRAGPACGQWTKQREEAG